MRKVLGKLGRILFLLLAGYLYLCLTWFIAELVFYGLVAHFGPEFFVGPENVIHNDNGGCWYTNPGAMIFWHLLIMLAEFVLTVPIVLVIIRASGSRCRGR